MAFAESSKVVTSLTEMFATEKFDASVSLFLNQKYTSVSASIDAVNE